MQKVYQFFGQNAKIVSIFFDKTRKVFHLFKKMQKVFHFFRQNAKSVSIFLKDSYVIDSMQHLVRYTNTLPVFGFNSCRYYINLIKSYLIPYLINEKKIEPSVIKKANDFVSFKFGDVQLLDIMKFLGKAYLRLFSKSLQSQ